MLEYSRIMDMKHKLKCSQLYPTNEVVIVTRFRRQHLTVHRFALSVWCQLGGRCSWSLKLSNFGEHFWLCVTWKTKLKPTVQEAMGRRATRVLLACELLMALFANAPSDYIPQGRNNSHYRHPQNAWLKVWFSWNPSQQTQNPFNHLFSFINKSAKIRIITSTATTMSSLIWQAWANLWSCTRVWVGTLLPILKGWF